MAYFLDEMDLTPNRIELARAAMPTGSYIDLTSSNPTLQGHVFPPEILRIAADGFWSRRVYRPDPRGNLQARESIAQYCNSRSCEAISHPENIFLTASTSEAYSLLFTMMCEPGDNVLAPDVGYPLFEHFAAMQHIELRPYRLKPEEGWQIDWASARVARNARTRAMLIVSPHNPTGAVVNELYDIGVPFVVDEVFAEFGARVNRVPFLGAQTDAPVFTLNGISKMFALPDLKLGWVAMNAPAARAYAPRFELINDAFLGANALSQYILPTLFDQGWLFVQQMCGTTRVNLRRAASLLRVPEPDGGYYLFAPIETTEDDETLVLRLLRSGVFVHPGHFYNHTDAPPRIMISCLTRADQLEQGLTKIIDRSWY